MLNPAFPRALMMALKRTYILKRKSFATVLHPFLLQYGPCEGILMTISYVPAQ